MSKKTWKKGNKEESTLQLLIATINWVLLSFIYEDKNQSSAKQKKYSLNTSYTKKGN